MSSFVLVIEVRLPGGCFHGRGPAGEPEWPPSPGRLFQALVAAAGNGRTGAQSIALAWLEQQAPPTIDTPPHVEGADRRTYVPNNDADQHDGQAGRFLKVVRPIHLPNTDTIRYVWPISEADRDPAGILAALAGKLRALGWGIDMAVGRGSVEVTCPEPHEGVTRWRPTEAVPDNAGVSVRVPAPGTLAGLDTDHRQRMARIDGQTQTLTDRAAPFKRVIYQTVTDLAYRPIRCFTLQDLHGRPASFWPRQTRDLSAMLRHQAHTTAKQADWPAADIEGYVCGHGHNGAPPPDHRLAYLPLPSIGHQHTDGMIRNLAIAEAPSGDGRRLQNLADRLIGRPLIDEKGDYRATLMPTESTDKVTWRYHRPQRHVWASVTPVVLPGFNFSGKRNGQQMRFDPHIALDKLSGHQRKTHKLMLKMLDEARIPSVLLHEVWLQKAPLWSNLPDVYKFATPKYLSDRPRFHVRLTFKHPVRGPITLGAGRFVGLGVCAAIL